MANITNYLNKIKTSVFGKDVRGAIHDAIKQVYDDASVNHDNANMEVKLARGTHNTLNDRLDKSDEIQAQTNAQLSTKIKELDDKKADKTLTTNLQGQINNLVVNGTGDSNPEVVQARGTFSLLNERLNKTDIAVSSVSEEVWEVQTTTKKDGYVKTDGSTSSSNFHIVLDVIVGEEYWLKTTSGLDLKPYVCLNAENAVVSYYPTQENSQVWHNYTNNILKIKITSGVTKLVVNSMDKAMLEVKKYVYNKLNVNSVKELPNEIVNINHLTPYLASLYGNNYSNVSFSVEKGFMESSGSLNTTTAEYAKVNVLKGEKYRITTNYGYNMCPYVLLNNSNVVVDYLASDSSSSLATKTFDCEIKSDGVLYVNTYNKLSTSIQKLVGYKINDDSLNKLTNKKAIFFGDSITEGQGSWADLGTIRGKNIMTGANYGVGGSKYTVTDGANDLNCIYNRVKANYSGNEDADYIILSGLVNDALQGMPIGTMLSDTDFTTECDVSTVYGAYEMALRYVLENWKGAKVGVIITPNIPSSTTLNNYFDVARNVCKKYSVPYLDLYYDSGLCVGIPAIKSTYYKGDDIHPNVLGYEKYINDKVEAFMKSL